MVAADPRFAVVCAVAIGFAGDLAQLERDISLRRLVDMVDLGRQEMADPAAIGREPAEAAVGAIFSALRAAAATGRLGDPSPLVPQYMFVAVRPYLGDAAAREELAAPRPRFTETNGNTDRTEPRTDLPSRISFPDGRR